MNDCLTRELGKSHASSEGKLAYGSELGSF
jgi:hypothetical protein